MDNLFVFMVDWINFKLNPNDFIHFFWNNALISLCVVFELTSLNTTYKLAIKKFLTVIYYYFL